MPMLAVVFPVADEKTAEWRTFIDELAGPQHEAFVESRRGLGVRERTFLQHSPMGDLVIVTLEGEDPEAAFGVMSQRTDAFATWFKKHVLSIHGVDLAAPPAGPLPELVADTGPV